MLLENGGFTTEAGEHYRLLLPHLAKLNSEHLERVSLFYNDVKRYDVVFKASKQAIEQQGDLGVFASLFINSWEHVSNDIEELEWLLREPGIEYLLKEQLAISKQLFTHHKIDTAYRIATRIHAESERNFRNNQSEFALFVETALNLIELEYELNNLPQARFHLRKLIYLQFPFLSKLNEIIYWAALLDELIPFIRRQDWPEIKPAITGDSLTLATLYEQLINYQISERLKLQLETTPFTDKRLEQKRHTYKQLLLKLTNEQAHVNNFDFKPTDDDDAPNDLLSLMLYHDRLQDEDKNAVRTRWKKEFTNHADQKEAIKTYWSLHEKQQPLTNEKKLDNCHVTFFGGGEKIGGTSILLTVDGQHLLLDAGMHLHEEQYYPDYSPMYEQGIQFSDIDALLITHAHMDHTGAVPYVYEQRPDLPMYATEATKALINPLLQDSVRIAKKTNPNFYDEQAVASSILSIQSVEFKQTFTIPSRKNEWKVTYYPAGHILGAAAIYIDINDICILFTGDFSVDEQKTVPSLQLPADLQVDVLITESTYGYLPANASISRKHQEKLLVESVMETMERQGSFLIPTFAVGRAQEVILILKDAFKDRHFLPFNLFVDGRVTDICLIYERFAAKQLMTNPAASEQSDLFFSQGVQVAQEVYSEYDPSLLKFTEFLEEFIFPGNSCVVTSSGMLMDGSRSARYAEQLIDDEKNTLSFTGYLDEESSGYHLLKAAEQRFDKKITINGQEKEIRATIEAFRLSAHASREQIIQLIADLQPQKVFLMHGEHDKRYEPVKTIVGGDVIYPTLIELLAHVSDSIEVIPAYNGKSYHL